MKQHKDRAIVMLRVDFGEKDRILTLLSREHGKISVIAKSVRAQKSKLAGGIELLCESDICMAQGRSDINTLTSARLRKHFINLASDMLRMQQAFEMLRIINKITHTSSGQEYYDVTLQSLSALDNDKYDVRLVEAWFLLQVLRLSGSVPNLDISTGENFDFDYDKQHFFDAGKRDGGFSRSDLKLLRICTTSSKPPKLQKVLGSEDKLISFVRVLLKTNLTEV